MLNLWNRFKQFPNADLYRFSSKGWFDDNIFCTCNDGRKFGVFDVNNLNSLNFSEEMKRALGLISGFPQEVTLKNQKLKIPAVEWYEEATNLGDKLTNHNIYVTRTYTFEIKFRDILIHMETTHSGKKAHKWHKCIMV